MRSALLSDPENADLEIVKHQNDDYVVRLPFHVLAVVVCVGLKPGDGAPNAPCV